LRSQALLIAQSQGTVLVPTFVSMIMSEQVVTWVALVLGVFLSFFPDTLTDLLKLCFIMTGRALRRVLVEEELSAIAIEFYEDNKPKSKKKVSIFSPHDKRIREPIAPLFTAWRPVSAVDGTPSGAMENVAFRWQYAKNTVVRCQGFIRLQRYGTTKLHRLVYDGYYAVDDDDGQATKGDKAYGTILLPVDSDSVVSSGVFKSEKRGTKHLGIRVEFGTNEDSLLNLQFLFVIGEDSERFSATLAFQEQLALALVGNGVDGDDRHWEVPATDIGSM
jgi:hypothetical protein